MMSLYDLYLSAIGIPLPKPSHPKREKARVQRKKMRKHQKRGRG